MPSRAGASNCEPLGSAPPSDSHLAAWASRIGGVVVTFGTSHLGIEHALSRLTEGDAFAACHRRAAPEWRQDHPACVDHHATGPELDLAELEVAPTRRVATAGKQI